MSVLIIGSGPSGPFDAFADSEETVQGWIAEGFLHQHEGMRLAEHRDVCRVCVTPWWNR